MDESSEVIAVYDETTGVGYCGRCGEQITEQHTEVSVEGVDVGETLLRMATISQRTRLEPCGHVFTRWPACAEAKQ